MPGFTPDCFHEPAPIDSVLPPLKAWRVLMHKNPVDAATSMCIRFLSLSESVGVNLCDYSIVATDLMGGDISPSPHNRLSLSFSSSSNTGSISGDATLLPTLSGTATVGWTEYFSSINEQWIGFLTDLIAAVPNILVVRVPSISSPKVGPYLIDVQYWDKETSTWITDWSVDTPQTPWASNETRTFYRPGFTP